MRLGRGQLEAEMTTEAWLVQKPSRSVLKLDRSAETLVRYHAPSGAVV